MKKLQILILIVTVFLSMAMCGCSGTSEPSPTAEIENYQYNNYLDEKNQLIFSYTNIFDSAGEPDQTGTVTFTSSKDNVVMMYSVLKNTNKETPEEFLDNFSPLKGEVLEGNAVVGLNDDTYLKTGEAAIPCAFYCVIDIDFIVYVEIACETDDEAEIWYNRLRSNAVYLESAAGTNTSTLDEDEALNLLSDELSGMLTEDTVIVSLGKDTVNGEDCWMFATGKNTPEKFTAEEHFAVKEDGSIYVLDIYNSNEYIPYTRLYFSDPPEDEG
ncbi:hypothetical protein Desor_2291 [Desulfosporosinus orientis DSM 765]|uniref:DUF5067 domain-containing protein n=1 Tax=Desulfosporosinus orientis (strain ATCC 19365 / DSM 765 / NCIMB 8382 / VKM B-1628 / Singapore I) TaxID=768706 RepID=G7WBA6_DESOD|nr:hypothetical protein [Desulfosporosinus orientis]AET67887.1 hypothetical protein Desor_2291 [Desulfosporosinus orientis DSM 765]